MTGLEDLGDLWIHVDEHVLFRLDLVIALLHLRLDPESEWVPHYRIDDVGYELPGQLLDLLLDREVLVHTRILLGEGLHILDRQALELRDIDVLDVSTLDALLRPRLDISEMPDGDVLEGRQVHIDL